MVSESTEAVNLSDSELIQQQNKRLLLLEKDILEAVALGNDPQQILDSLCCAAETMLQNSTASIMLYDQQREYLNIRAAPKMPEQVIDKVNGLKPGPDSGSCGTAVHTNQPVYVENTCTDARWFNFRQLAQDFSICACWSHPIRAKDGLAIGSFALSSYEYRPPSFFQKRLLNVAANIAGIVLQREKQEQELWDLAHRDLITGIPNRILLNQRLHHAIDCSHRQKTKLALLFIDLDNFKKINDTHGHKTGDKVLIEAASRIESCIRSGDTLSRYGGDEFVLLAEDISESYNVGAIAEKIIQTLSKTMYFEDTSLVVTPSIGISVYPNDADDAETLLVNADTAMYQAKANGRNNYICYEPELTRTIQNRLKIEDELRFALLNDEFVLHYQPQYSNTGDGLLSVEALVRWQHPDKGLIMPAEFVSIAEQSGLIREIGQRIVKKACQQGQQWLDKDLKIGRIAINISAVQICDGCFNFIQKVLDETGFPAENLEIEITESLMVQQSEEVLTELHLIQDAGITIALDDFGTGYSSLSQLQTLPINKLKIDRSFITNIPGNQNGEIIAKTIIAMGRNLGLNVIAEGVETKEQASFLLEEGCNAYQGYYLSRPLAAADLEEKMASNEFISPLYF